MNGRRIYAESIDQWRDGTLIPDVDKVAIIREVAEFLGSRRESTIVVINRDDPAAGLWEQACVGMRGDLAGIEYTSEAEKRANWRAMLRGSVKNGLVVDGVKITNECELEEAVERLSSRRAARSRTER
jgi:hypothetical protein